VKLRFQLPVAASLLAATSVFWALPVAAQRVSLADRVALLEQRALDAGAASSNASVDLLNQLSELRGEVRELRGQVEILTQQNAQLTRSLRGQSFEFDERLQALERAVQIPSAEDAEAEAEAAPVQQDSEAAALVTTAEVTAEAAPEGAEDAADLAPDPAQERAQYEAAFDALKSGRYSEAARLFQAFLHEYPDADYAANARYWMGESYYVVEDYANAQRQFEALVAAFPEHDKTPGALLKIGLSQYGQRRLDEAEATLGEVQRRWPGTDAASIAADRLRAIQLSRLQ